jgi:mercuric ion binding protein
MKTINQIILGITIFMLSKNANAQNDTVRIKTSAVCEQCKARIENDLSFEKGIKSANLDIQTNIVTVIYNSKKTNKEIIRQAITHIGYDADSLKADIKNYNRLPDCCKHPEKPN